MAISQGKIPIFLYFIRLAPKLMMMDQTDLLENGIPDRAGR